MALGVPLNVTVAEPPEQMVAFAAIVAVGGGKTVMVIIPETGCVQLGVPEVVILTKVKIVVVAKVFVIVAVPEAFKVTVCVPPGFVLYVTVAFGVPVKVTVALAPEQIVALLEIATVGVGTTAITTEPVSGRVQLGVPADTMLTNVNVVVAV